MADKYLFEDSNTSLALLYAIILSIFSFLPPLGLTGFIAYRIVNLKTIGSKLNLIRTKKHTVNHQSSNESTTAIAQHDLQDDDSDQKLPDCMLHPQQYTNSFEKSELREGIIGFIGLTLHIITCIGSTHHISLVVLTIVSITFY